MIVYAAFDTSGACLYVGSTEREHPVFRWAEHVRSGKPWTRHAVRFEALADLSEKAATERLLPTFSEPGYAKDHPAGFLDDPARSVVTQAMDAARITQDMLVTLHQRLEDAGVIKPVPPDRFDRPIDLDDNIGTIDLS